jgi:hypothetical protein
MLRKPFVCGAAVTVCALCLVAALLTPTFAQQEAVRPEQRSGLWRGRLVTYDLVGDRLLFEGDILLDHVTEPSEVQPPGFGIAYDQYLWPKVGSVYQIPYVITSGSANLTTAIAQFNSTFTGQIQLVAHTSETDYVNFNLDTADQSGVCESSVGRVGGQQQVGGSIACTVATLLHEMGHVVGLYHEQSRSDRATYVNVLYANVIKASRANFDQIYDNAQAVSSYNYASVMHYIPFAFSRNGGPTIESIPPGIGLSNTSGYNTGDVDTVRRIYGFIPSTVTIASNPPGLQVVVDGTTITTPKKYTWALNSTHTLAVPSGSQTLSGTVYTFGRWSDKTAASHTITITPGRGTRVEPATAPGLSVYSANFIKLLPFSLAVSPTGAGTATAIPAPKSYPPATGTYYVDRTSVTLTATPNSGQNFYSWWGYLPGPSGANPLVGRTPYGTVTAAFTSSPVFTVTTSPAGHWLYVDGGFNYGPRNFALPYDTSWTTGSMHTLGTVSPQYPYSSNTRYAFANWSDGGAITHTIQVPASSSTYTAALTPQYYLADWYYPGCAASLGVMPSSPDGFYDSGTTVTLSETPATGWVFTGWQYDLSGTASSAPLTMNDEELAVANYNTVATPLSISSIWPGAVPAGEGAFTLTVNGKGFTASTIAFVNGVYRAPTYVSPTRLTLAMQSGDVSAPEVFQVAVANYPAGAVCYTYVPTQFFVLEPGSLIWSSTVVTSSRNPAPLGSNVTLTASVFPNTFPTLSGTVTFRDGTTVLATLPLNSADRASYSTTSLALGNHAITATYNGNSTFASSVSATLTQVIQ